MGRGAWSSAGQEGIQGRQGAAGGGRPARTLIHHAAYKPATLGGSHSISFSALIYNVFTAIYAAGVSGVEIYHEGRERHRRARGGPERTHSSVRSHSSSPGFVRASPPAPTPHNGLILPVTAGDAVSPPALRPSRCLVSADERGASENNKAESGLAVLRGTPEPASRRRRRSPSERRGSSVSR